MISINSKIPSAKVFQHAKDDPTSFDIAEYTAKGTVVLFALPAAFSPTCTDHHLPGFIKEAANLRAKGVDKIACVSVNDTFVMNAWGNQLGSIDAGIDMIADADAEFTKAVGSNIDLSAAGLGIRSVRYSMIIRDGIITAINEEPDPTKLKVSGAEDILAAL